MPITKQELLQDKRTQRLLDNSLANNSAAEFSAGVFDTVTLTAIFSMFTSPVTAAFLDVTGKYFLFPFAALANILRSVAAWRQVYLEKFSKKDSIVKAVVETLVTIAITFAIAASLLATAVFGGFISPLIFTITLGLKSIYQIGAAGFYLGKASLSADPVLRAQNLSAFKDNAVAALSTTLATTAVLFVFVLAKPYLAAFGIAAGIVGVGLTVHGVYRALSSKDEKFDPEVNSDDELVDDLDTSHSHGQFNGPIYEHGARKPHTAVNEPKPNGSLSFATRHDETRPTSITSISSSSSSANVLHTLSSVAASTPSPTSGSDSAVEFKDDLSATRSFSSPHATIKPIGATPILSASNGKDLKVYPVILSNGTSTAETDQELESPRRNVV